MPADSAPRRSPDPESLPEARPSRRTIIQAGAWAVPAIVLATAAPAAAASLNKKLNFTNFSVWYEWNSQGQRVAIAGNTVVWLSGDADATVNLVTLVVGVPAADMAPTATVDATSTGWSFTGAAAGGSTINYTFTWTGGELVVGGSAYTSVLVFHLQSTGAIAPLPGGRAWTAVASASGADPATDAGGLSALSPTAAVDAIAIAAPGVLVLDLGSSPAVLRWEGAAIAYAGAEEVAHVPYLAQLYRDGAVIASLSGSGVDVPNGESAIVPSDTYAGPEPGRYHVVFVIIGTNGIRTAESDPLDVA